MGWRPKNWAQLLLKHMRERLDNNKGDLSIEWEMLNCAEAGADAMYEPAYQKGGRDERQRLLKYLKSLLVSQPRASLAATIDLIEATKPEEDNDKTR